MGTTYLRVSVGACSFQYRHFDLRTSMPGLKAVATKIEPVRITLSRPREARLTNSSVGSGVNAIFVPFIARSKRRCFLRPGVKFTVRPLINFQTVIVTE